MKKLAILIITILTTFTCDCVDMRNVSFDGDISSTRSRTPPIDQTNVTRLRTPPPVDSEMSVRSHTPPLRPRTPPIEYAMPYIPQHHDFSEEFHNESLLCFKLRRWVFQPISVVLQVTAGGLLIGSQCCISRYPEIAKILTGVSLGIGASSFAINALLLNIDTKLEDLNDRITQRQQNDIFPAIIQR